MAAYLPRPEEERSRGRERRQGRNGERAAASPVRQHSGNRRHVDRHGRPTTWQYSCGLCQQDHALSSCARFRGLTPFHRYETVERRGYCRNCLARSHLAPDCPSITGCRHCNYRHHSLLHGASQLDNSLEPAIRDDGSLKLDIVFVPTATVRVSEDGVDRWSSIRALVNQGSTMSRIAYSTYRRLGLRSFTYRGNRFAHFRLMPRNVNSTWALRVNALITDNLPTRPYSDPIIDDPTQDFTNNTLADMDPRSNTPIDLELGADVYPALQREGKVATGLGDVYAYPTTLGYILTGPIRNLPRE
ncbi:uncharacterized protein LOC131997352 [Stomoxys calcitrans]|uniref:uncharacterized protein LOC131995212 n=1 Tax=Stomoxys calcitrans TaxID=35570 RepID=UPI0027E32D18|nr:uncharacterized protein LOC131995212 [Stomoxys calcitrans]XP_059220996.1 uncharacterized protein LOC131995838 [Stomoxys calcitrans]XP_059224212.1 uncharacterized protein LOC131997352 [Stomoxys calcitrans]